MRQEKSYFTAKSLTWQKRVFLEKNLIWQKKSYLTQKGLIWQKRKFRITSRFSYVLYLNLLIRNFMIFKTILIIYLSENFFLKQDGEFRVFLACRIIDDKFNLSCIENLQIFYLLLFRLTFVFSRSRNLWGDKFRQSHRRFSDILELLDPRKWKSP